MEGGRIPRPLLGPARIASKGCIMQGDMPIQDAIPSLMSTQLLTAEVYSLFLGLSREGEADLWKKLLMDELEHIEHVRNLLRIDLPGDLSFPFINVERVRDVCARAAKNGEDLFLLRLEGALRIECAELDYGLEGLVAKRLEKKEVLPGYQGDITEHLSKLLSVAERYSMSPNIGLQMRRLTELVDTCMADTSIHPRSGSDIILRQG